MKRKQLEDLGLEKEVIDTVMDLNGADVTRVKAELEQAKSDLANAQQQMEEISTSNKDNEALQKQLADYEAKISQIETERANERKTNLLKTALTEAGATDIDYMVFKLGELDVDADGNIVELDNKVKALKESNPSFFGSQSDEAAKDEPKAPGYKVIDNGLKQGKTSETEPQTLAEAIAEKFK